MLVKCEMDADKAILCVLERASLSQLKPDQEILALALALVLA